jgi:hypothetical protein
MDKFINDQNIKRFRKLASAATTATERKQLLDLLAEEHAKHLDLHSARTTTP